MSAAEAARALEVPFVPLRDVVVFPGVVVPLQISRVRSLTLVDALPPEGGEVVFFTQLDSNIEIPGGDDFYSVGCRAVVTRKYKAPDGTTRLLVQGQQRVKFDRLIGIDPVWRSGISLLKEIPGRGGQRRLKALSRTVDSQFKQLLSLAPETPEEVLMALHNMQDPGQLADLIAGGLNIAVEEKIDLLSEVKVIDRLEKLSTILARELDVAQLGHRIQSEVQNTIGDAQREHVVREQIRLLRQELGDAIDESTECDELREQVRAIGLPETDETEVLREIDRLERIPPSAAEAAQVRTWIDWVIDLPWGDATEDNLNLRQARKVFDEDHAHLDKVKERLIEFLAVRKLKPDARGGILCFAGPPGTGKTSLGRSIARALGREFVRLSLGGISDEAEIRGHRRTYVGALPGRILRELKRCGSRNPVFMLDEVDKLGRDHRGDPAAALLEVLDPEQNDDFQDNYLGLPFDLSEVLFICTVNRVDTLPVALRDRLEIIRLDGYTREEKLEIATTHLLPDQRREHGLRAKDLSVPKKVLGDVISRYTREAGVRQLQRAIGTLCRKAARRRVDNRSALKVSPDNLQDLFDRVPARPDKVRGDTLSGVATGLAWTSTGGMILDVEALHVPGRRPIVVTGSLGDVMKESARIAYTVARSMLGEAGTKAMEKRELHVHCPAGAIPKDGPSAGITLLAAILSRLTETPLDPGVAMTGELTLRGAVLPVGGIKSKVLAAQRAGAHTVILPEANREDWKKDVPSDVRSAMKVKFVKIAEDVKKVLGL